MEKGNQKNTDENPTGETPGINPALSCSAPSVVSEPPLVPELQIAEFSSDSLASQASITTNPEYIGAKFCPEPLFSSIVVQRYDGEMHGDLFHGEGTAYFLGGNTYKGMFAEGYMHGRGVYTWADGVIYEGDFVLNVPTGYGKYAWLDGSWYEGEVQNGLRHGVGTYRCGTKCVSYCGQWHHGKRHGKGKIFYNQEMTSWYEGDWVNNTIDGWGVRRYPSGNVYEGQWKNSRRHGEGTMKWLTLGQQYSGHWENGIQMELAMLRHVAELRNAYCFYSRLGHVSPDNTFLLSRLQFWRLLKDCKVHQEGITLAQMDRIVGSDDAPEDIHSPFGTLLLRNFLSHLVILANHIYYREMPSSGNMLVTCFSKLMEDNILPNATNVKGILFSYPLHAAVASHYVMRCWEIYQYFCKQYSRALRNLTLTMRHFIWMLKDLNVYDNKLTTGKVLEILFAESLPLEDVSHGNLDLEMTFLEFLEALLGCAEVKQPYTIEISPKHLSEISRQGETGATPASKELSVDPAHLLQGPSSLSGKSGDVLHHLSTFEEKDRKQEVERGPALPNLDTDSSAGLEGEPPAALTCSMPALETRSSIAPSPRAEPSEEAGTESESEQTLWASRIHLFFRNTFFPAYERRLLLDREAENERVKKEQVQIAPANTAEATGSQYSL